jgi:hypothetical protein
MKNLIITIVALLSFSITQTFGQNWKFDFKIKSEKFYSLSGSIDNKYPVKMHLEHDDFLCGNSYDDDRSIALKGWYYYEKTKIKIPLTGSYNNAEGLEYVRLYVPVNQKDKITKNDCILKNYTELFENNTAFDLTSMRWKMKKSASFKNVKLNIDHQFRREKKTEMIFTPESKKSVKIDISENSGAKYIEEIKLFDTKKINEKYHATFEFWEWSRQDDNANAMCGAGLERYLGYIRINKKNEIEEVRIAKIESCWNMESVEQVMIVPGKPELGLVTSD